MKLLFVLFLRDHARQKDRDHSAWMAPAIWAAFQELEALFAGHLARAHTPELGVTATTARYAVVPAWAPRLDGAAPLAGPRSAAEACADKKFWEDAAGKFFNTYRAERIAEQVRTVLGAEAAEGWMVLVTDQELAPEQLSDKARYVIAANSGAHTQLVATPVLDPGYWDQDDPHRLATIKQRVRAACGRAAGELLGMQHCATPRCFLRVYGGILAGLDQMVGICDSDRHEAPELKWKAFLPVGKDPAAVQAVLTIPQLKVDTLCP